MKNLDILKATTIGRYDNNYTCFACNTPYPSKRALTMHINRSNFCRGILQQKFIVQYSPRLADRLADSVINHPNMKEGSGSNENIAKSSSTTSADDNTVPIEQTLEAMADTSVRSNDETSKNDLIDHKTSQPFYHTNGLRCEIKLLKLLDEIGTPLYAYKAIMDWAKDAYLSNYDFNPRHSERNDAVKYLENLLHMNACRPKTIPVQLQGDNMKLEVVVFDVVAMLSSLLNDPELTQEENLVVSTKDRFSKYETEDNRLGEVNSGLWYERAYQNMIKNPDKDFLCPLILASDKTTLSEKGDLHIDAIFMTTSIFNIKVSQRLMKKCIIVFMVSTYYYNVFLDKK
jgi:hypothetical protein